MKNCGLILEGGGMRGIYTTGVLDFFLDHQIDFPYIIGVSAGACHGASFMSKQRGRAYAVNVDYLDDKRYLSYSNLFKTGSIFGMDMLFDTIPNTLNVYDKTTFYASKSKMEMVVTNIETGRAEYYPFEDCDKDIIYMQASSSLPMLANIVEVNNKKLLDGGISDSIPIKHAQELGYDKNIIILTRDKHYRKSANKLVPLLKTKYRAFPNLLNALKNRHIEYNKTIDYIHELESNNEVFVIQPSIPLKLGRLEKNKDVLHQVYLQGYKDAENKYNELKTFLDTCREIGEIE